MYFGKANMCVQKPLFHDGTVSFLPTNIVSIPTYSGIRQNTYIGKMSNFNFSEDKNPVLENFYTILQIASAQVSQRSRVRSPYKPEIFFRLAFFSQLQKLRM